MSVAVLLRNAEAWAQSELGAQLRLLECLSAHERALGSGRPEDIAETLEAVDHELRLEPSRARERRQWADGLARAWRIDVRTVTLRSVVQRAGEDGQRLERLRLDLERAARDTAAAGRRVAMIARTQRALLGDLLRTLTGADPESPTHASGTLVDASA